MSASQLAELLEDRALRFGAELRKPDMKAPSLDEGEAEESVRKDRDGVDRSGADDKELRDGAPFSFVGAAGGMAVGCFCEAICGVRLILQRCHVYRKCVVQNL